MPQDPSRRALRQSLLLRRDALSTAQRTDASRVLGALLVQHLDRHFGALDQINVGAYLSIGSEPDISSSFALFASVGVPEVVGEDRPLRFLRYRAGDALVRQKFGVAVPAVAEDVLPNLLLVPCVGFHVRADRGVDRLGYGGGFYDRTLAQWHGPAIGIAFGVSRIEDFEVQPHDQPLLGVITEQGYIGR